MSNYHMKSYQEEFRTLPGNKTQHERHAQRLRKEEEMSNKAKTKQHEAENNSKNNTDFFLVCFTHEDRQQDEIPGKLSPETRTKGILNHLLKTHAENRFSKKRPYRFFELPDRLP